MTIVLSLLAGVVLGFTAGELHAYRKAAENFDRLLDIARAADRSVRGER